MSRRSFQRRGSIPGPPQSPYEPLQPIVESPLESSFDDMDIDSTFSTVQDSIPLPPDVSLIDLDALLSTPLSPVVSPPSRPLPQTPSSPYEEDKSEFEPFTLSSDSTKNIALSFDSDPLVWMKKSCSNADVSAITYLDYQDFEKLDLFNIRFLSSDGKSFQSEVQCISRQELLEWLSSDINVLPPTNIMSIYTTPIDMSPSSLETGFTAKPTKRYIVRLPPSNFYVTLGSVHRLLSLPDKHWFALPLFGGKRRRVGNLFGYYGSSMNHGQIPGEIIYKLYTLDDLKQNVVVNESIDDYPLPLEFSIYDIPFPFIPTDDYISYVYGSENSTSLFFKMLFKQLFGTYIQNTKYSTPYSLINTLSYETSLSIDTIHQIFTKNKLVDINTQNTKGYTALMVLLLNKFNNIPDDLLQLLLSYLLSKNPDIDITNDDDNSTAIMYAFKNQKISDPFLLLQMVNSSKKFDTKDKDGWNATMYAFNNEIIYQYPSQLILTILNKTKDINLQEKLFGMSTLMFIFKNASPHLSNKSILDKLFTMNPNFDLQNKRGKTAFMYAAYNYNKYIHYSVFNRIISTNPNINLQSLIGETVLSIALSSPYVSNNLIHLLLKLDSIDINTQLTLSNSIVLDDEDNPSYEPELYDGYSPLMIALDNPRIHPSIISTLLSMNPNINHTNAFGETALMISINNRSKHLTSQVILSILNLNPDINKQDNSGHSALTLSILNFSGKFDESIAQKILDMSPNINTYSTDEHLTPLILAIYNPSGIITSSTIYKILSLSPNINHITTSGYTVLSICFNTLTRNNPQEFVPVDIFDFILTLPIDYNLNKQLVVSYMTDATLNLSVNYPNYFIQYSPIFDKIKESLKNS